MSESKAHKEIIPSMMTSLMTNALKYRHEYRFDIFISEFACHVASKYFLMDAWAMPRGYDKDYIGYEVKASRQDFLRDKKWQNYLDFCNKFFFVCPAGMIDPKELPEDVGLIYFNIDKNSLRIKKQAKWTPCELTTKTWKYIAMQLHAS